MAKTTTTKTAAVATRKTAPRAAAKKTPAAKPAPAAKTTASKADKLAKTAKAGKTAAPARQKPGVKVKTGKAAGQHGVKKEKTVRDSFNMPAPDYALIGQLKARALAGAREAKKSELLRAGLRLLAGLTDEAFHAALGAVPSIKTGRPGKKHKG